MGEAVAERRVGDLPFVSGDIVTLKSDPGTKMTVGYCSAHKPGPSRSANTVLTPGLFPTPCMWFSNGQLCAEWFMDSALVKVGA